MMNLKNKKMLIILIFALMLILVIISTLVENKSNKSDSSEQDLLEENKYVYNFNETLNLETEKGLEENESIGTEYSNLGVIPDFYHDNDVEYVGEEIHLTSFEGTKVVSFSWPEEEEQEGLIANIQEPEFGILDRIISNKNDRIVTIIYKEVSIKDVESYFKILNGCGFTNVESQDKNKSRDYYNFILNDQKGNRIVVNYEDGMLNIKLM